MPKYKTKKTLLEAAEYAPNKGAPQRFNNHLPSIRVTSEQRQAIELDAIKRGVVVQEWRRNAYDNFLLNEKIKPSEGNLIGKEAERLLKSVAACLDLQRGPISGGQLHQDIKTYLNIKI